MNSAEKRLLSIANEFEVGNPIGSFEHRLDIERAIYFVAVKYSKFTLKLQLDGFSPRSLDMVKAELAKRNGLVSSGTDVLVAFELRQQLKVLSLSEPYRLSSVEKIDSAAFKAFGRQLRKWVLRVQDRLSVTP